MPSGTARKKAPVSCAAIFFCQTSLLSLLVPQGPTQTAIFHPGRFCHANPSVLPPVCASARIPVPVSDICVLSGSCIPSLPPVSSRLKLHLLWHNVVWKKRKIPFHRPPHSYILPPADLQTRNFPARLFPSSNPFPRQGVSSHAPPDCCPFPKYTVLYIDCPFLLRKHQIPEIPPSSQAPRP